MNKVFIPIVNKKDKIIKYLLYEKQKIHEKGLRHREIVVYIFNPKHQILVQKRQDNKTLDHSVAGHVQKGETYLQAALRELKEEVSLKLYPKQLKKIGKFYHNTYSSHKDFYNNRFFCLYVVKQPIPIQKLCCNKREIKTLKFMDIKQLKKLIKLYPLKFEGGFLISFPLLLKHLKNSSK